MIAFNASFASARVFLYRKGVMVWPSSVACVDTQLGLEGQGERVFSLITSGLYAPWQLAASDTITYRLVRHRYQLWPFFSLAQDRHGNPSDDPPVFGLDVDPPVTWIKPLLEAIGTIATFAPA